MEDYSTLGIYTDMSVELYDRIAELPINIQIEFAHKGLKGFYTTLYWPENGSYFANIEDKIYDIDTNLKSYCHKPYVVVFNNGKILTITPEEEVKNNCAPCVKVPVDTFMNGLFEFFLCHECIDAIVVDDTVVYNPVFLSELGYDIKNVNAIICNYRKSISDDIHKSTDIIYNPDNDALYWVKYAYNKIFYTRILSTLGDILANISKEDNMVKRIENALYKVAFFKPDIQWK